MKDDTLGWLMSTLGGLLIVTIGIGTWISLVLIVAIADTVGPVPFSIVAGLALSRHHRSCEARGERAQRTPTALLR